MMARENLRRIAITGARGRIGSTLCEKLRATPAVVEGYSIQPDSDSLFATRSLTQPGVLRNIDTLIHAGWGTMPLSAENHPSGVWIDDLPLLAGILDAARSLPVDQRPHLIFLSSAAVYGRNEDGCDEVDATPDPKSWYAFGKLSAERLIQEFARRFDLKCTVLRLSNVYGVNNGSSTQGIMPRLLHGALRGEEVDIWGDGRTAKDYLHIHDVVSAISKAVEVDKTGVYNLSYGRSCPLDDLISYVEENVGKPLRRKYCPAFDWDVSQPLIKNRRFSEAFDWCPCVSIRDGILKCRAQLG